MASDTDTDRAAAWYLAATPGTMSQWLVRLWRTTAALDLLVVVTAFLLPAGTFPLRRLAPLLAASAFINVERASRRAGARPTSRAMSAAHLLLQVALLTGLLELSGGPSNPFSVIYAVQVALAAVTLGAGWASVVAGWTALCYGLLISWHLEELVPAHHRLIDFPTHLFTMWLALAAMVELAAHFIGAASRAVAKREAELASMREQATRTERLVSLTTLAAGAAHELSTPLATIAIASKELERALSRAAVPSEYTADARLIREEVDRCQLILDQMSGRAGGSGGETSEVVGIDAVLADVRARLTSDLAGRLSTHTDAALPAIVVPRAGLVQVLLSLIKNAFDATKSGDAVTLEVNAEGGLFKFVVQDQGQGMSQDTLRRAGEPFYTTKDAGQGLGLGVFLARAFAERCGGSLSLRFGSRHHRGAHAAGRDRANRRGLMSDAVARDGRTLLVVDDDVTFRTRLARALRDRGLEVTATGGYDEAIAAAQQDTPELALVDLRLPTRSGLDVVRSLKALDPTTVVVVLTGYGSIATAVESVKIGATTYLTKPVDADQILAAFNGVAAAGSGPATFAVPSLARVEWEHIQRVLADCGGNLSQAARLLGIHRRSLQRKLSKDPVAEGH